MEHLLIILLILGSLALFATEKFRPDVVAIMVMMALILSGRVSIAEGFSGFSNPAVITVVGMFIISAGLVRTGVADYIGNIMLRVSGANPVFITITVMLTVGLLSAFMNNIAATAILISTMYAIARKTSYSAGKLLIPLSFGSLLGGITTLIGTPPNLLISIILEENGFVPFSLFSFAPVGGIIMTGGILYMAFIGRHLLPEDKKESLTGSYHLEKYLTEISIPAQSPLVGKTIRESNISAEYGLTVLRIKRFNDGQSMVIAPHPESVLQAKDRLIVEGNIEHLMEVKGGTKFDIHIESEITDENLAGADLQMVEAAIAPNSGLIGQSIQQADIRKRYGVLAIALRRRGAAILQDYAKESLQAGDVLLLQGKAEAVAGLAQSPSFLLTKVLEQKPRTYVKAPYAVGSLLVAVVLAASNTLHISAAAFTGVLLMIFTGCIKVEELYKTVEWQVVFLVACMLPLGIAMDEAHGGTAAWMAGHLVNFAGDRGPLLVLAVIFIFTTLLTEVMSNAAAAVLLGPIGIAIAVGMNLAPHPFLMAIAIAASTTFLTPIGHQNNVLVYSIWGYKFSDFFKVGIWLNVIVFILAMIFIPLFWPFTPLS